MRKVFPFLALLIFVAVAGCDSDSINSSNNTDEAQEKSTTERHGPFIPKAGSDKVATGSATLLKLSNGMLRVDFSDAFSLTPGPSLFVFLSNAEFPSSDAVNLGAFLNPTGAQMYNVPAGLSLDSFTHVVVYCIPYDVTFAFAELK